MRDFRLTLVLVPIPKSDAVGQEIDILIDVTINARTDLFFGYSRIFSGSFIADTPPFIAVDADFVYTRLTRRF